MIRSLRRSVSPNFCCRAHIYTHRSAIADYWFYVINKILFALAFAFLIAVSSSVAEQPPALYSSAIGNSPQFGNAELGRNIDHNL